MKTVAGDSLDGIGAEFCEMCGAPRGDLHAADGVHEQILSILCQNVGSRPVSCLRALQRLAMPDATLAQIGKVGRVSQDTVRTELRRLARPT